MTDTTVRVNGQPAGPTHQGGFYRFHYDVSSLVKFGANNLLEVSVSKESANASVNRAERRGDYWTFGGIYRPVWLEARPRDHIEWTAIDARANGSFYAKGYFDAWRWLTLSTASERVTVENIGAVPFFGLYRPNGGVNPVLELPGVGWSFLHVIPATGTKFDLPEMMGPQSQTRTLRGVQRGELRLNFEALCGPTDSATR